MDVSQEEKSMRRRPRGSCIKVWVSDQERQEIVARAIAARMSQSEFLRSLGLNLTVLSKSDLVAVQHLSKVNGDLGRVAGLLKLWLATKRGEGAKAIEVDQLMIGFRAAQKELTHIMGQIVHDR